MTNEELRVTNEWRITNGAGERNEFSNGRNTNDEWSFDLKFQFYWTLENSYLWRINPLVKVEKRPDHDPFDLAFSKRKFVRTLSYREFATSFSLALLLLAVYAILDYYSNESWIGNNLSAIKWTLFCILVPVNHIFYKAEHGRANNFIGRNLHDYIYLLFFLSLYQLRQVFYGSSFSFGIGGVGGAIVFVLMFIIIVLLFELVVAILKRGLKLFRWQPL